MNINDIQQNQIFTNKKSGSVIKVRWDWSDYSKSVGYVQFNKIDENGNKVGPLLSSSFKSFIKNYEAAR